MLLTGHRLRPAVAGNETRGGLPEPPLGALPRLLAQHKEPRPATQAAGGAVPIGSLRGLKDKSCIEECPADCIYEGGRMLYIHPDGCVDCGACEPVCPVEAIHHEDDLREAFVAYRTANAEFFADLGSLEGATKTGLAERDAAFARTVPARSND